MFMVGRVYCAGVQDVFINLKTYRYLSDSLMRNNRITYHTISHPTG